MRQKTAAERRADLFLEITYLAMGALLAVTLLLNVHLSPKFIGPAGTVLCTTSRVSHETGACHLNGRRADMPQCPLITLSCNYGTGTFVCAVAIKLLSSVSFRQRPEKPVVRTRASSVTAFDVLNSFDFAEAMSVVGT